MKPYIPGNFESEAMVKMLEEREIWKKGCESFYSWLDQTREDVLEPQLSIIDSHHHIWYFRDLRGYNLFGIFRQQYYMTDEMIDDFICGGHNITHSVFVSTHAFFKKDPEPEYMAPLGEVQFVQGIAAQFASGKYGGKFLGAAAGIVGSADLLKYGSEIEPLLIACKNASPNYRGIRCTASHDATYKSNFHPSPGMYSDQKFRQGFALLEKHDLLFDAWLFSSQLPDVHDLALTFPGVTIILNHMGTPLACYGSIDGYDSTTLTNEEIVTQWKENLTKIATECPNVYVKVGGFGVPYMGHGFQSRDKPPSSEEVASLFKDMYLWTIQTFGAKRCMFESNFPADKVSMSYTVLWNAYKRMTKDAGLSDEDRACLFSETAKKVYRIV